MINITITNNDKLSRSVMVRELTQPGFFIMAVTDTSKALMLLLNDNNLPDIAIIHYLPQRPETLIAAEWIKKHHPSVKVIITCQHDFGLPPEKLRQAGIEGLVVRDKGDTVRLYGLINKVYMGGRCL